MISADIFPIKYREYIVRNNDELNYLNSDGNIVMFRNSIDNIVANINFKDKDEYCSQGNQQLDEKLYINFSCVNHHLFCQNCVRHAILSAFEESSCGRRTNLIKCPLSNESDNCCIVLPDSTISKLLTNDENSSKIFRKSIANLSGIIERRKNTAKECTIKLRPNQPGSK